MKIIEKPTKPGLYGYSMKHWTNIDFVNVYRNNPISDSPMLKSKVVGSTHMGLTIADHPADSEWYTTSWWDQFRLTVAEMFGRHNWPKRTLRTDKVKKKWLLHFYRIRSWKYRS